MVASFILSGWWWSSWLELEYGCRDAGMPMNNRPVENVRPNANNGEIGRLNALSGATLHAAAKFVQAGLSDCPCPRWLSPISPHRHNQDRPAPHDDPFAPPNADLFRVWSRSVRVGRQRNRPAVSHQPALYLWRWFRLPHGPRLATFRSPITGNCFSYYDMQHSTRTRAACNCHPLEALLLCDVARGGHEDNDGASAIDAN